MEPSEHVLRGLLSAAPDALLVVSADGRIQYVSEQAERLFGWAGGELVGQLIEVLVPGRFGAGHPDLRAGYVQAPETRPMGAGLNLWARRGDGTEFPAEISLSTVVDEQEGLLVLAAVRDITERLEIEAERAARAREAQLEQSHRLESLGQLAGGVAHDFNNLLGVILNYTALLSRSASDAQTQADIDEIRAAAERGARLTRQLLTFARRDVVQPQPLEVTEVVRSIASMLTRTIGEHLKLRLELPDEAMVTVADRNQLEQILVNLAINARDAMPDGGLLTIRVHAEERPGAEMVVVEVEDTGTGMPPEVAKRVFEPFFTTKDRTRGSGLGLATVYGIVQASGGEISVDSTVGVGTTVTVALKRTERRVAAPTAVPAAAPSGGTERILLVEDEEPLRIGTARLLRDHGYDVLVAADGLEALTMIEVEGETIDLVLTDVAMPRMRGDDLAGAMVERGVSLPVVFMSGYDSGLVELDGTLLEKPVPRTTLLRAVREALDG